MTYFLDFDRTLFDTDRLVKMVCARPEIISSPFYSILSGPPSVERGMAYARIVNEGILTLESKDIKPLVYEDSTEFLKNNSCVIVTFGDISWQRYKVERSFENYQNIKTLYTLFEKKGPALMKVLDTYTPPYIFVDDDVGQLDSVSDLNADIAIYEMRRDGKEGSGKYPVLTSLNELRQ